MKFLSKKQIVDFDEVSKDDIGLVGGKGANLGEMVKIDLPVPSGFIVTSQAYFQFIKKNHLKKEIERILKPLKVEDPKQLKQASDDIKTLIINSKVPKKIADRIMRRYERMGNIVSHPLVAVRSSATAEDLPDASFAGQQETYLNIQGEANLVNRTKDCWASLFTPRAIFYREEKKFSHFDVGIAVIVQRMVQSHTSGVMFTIDPVSNNKKNIVIEAIYGLGEYIVQGTVTPDRYHVDRLSFEIEEKDINRQTIKLTKKGKSTKERRVRKKDQQKQKIKDEHIVELAKLGKKIHQYYFFPQDIEWAIENDEIYILQSRPVTTIKKCKKSKSKINDLEDKQELKIELPLLIEGIGASPGISSGYTKVIHSADEIDKVAKDEILVAPKTTPDFVPAMKRASAIITDHGGQTSHAAIVSREMGIPCVVGTETATSKIKQKQVVTVNGKTGKVYKGGLSQKQKKTLKIKKSAEHKFEIDISKLKTATKVYVNLAEPDLAEHSAEHPVDGVGLLRAEFMISQKIKQHPKRLIELGKEKIFIEQLQQGIEKFCNAFNPRPVVYRTTDFKTNEYRNLEGGNYFEPEEENPLIGFRGALRYITNEKVFEMEMKAVKNIRKQKKLKNLWLMIPFVRTVDELRKVKQIIKKAGLKQSPSFKLWMMVEIPSNVILLEDFIKEGIDGVSIGSNDLTMLMLGIDRDNEHLSKTFNEQDPAVLWALERTIKTCLKHKISCSICGQAPSLYPDLTEKLVDWGITSISVSPDMIETTKQTIYQSEKRIGK